MPERRIVLKTNGEIDPFDITTYMQKGGFKGLEKAKRLSSKEATLEVIRSKLRGRGGAGFPCGQKWELVRKSKADEKYLICNADEGEVGTFKDRHIITHDPFRLVEGLAIAAHAIGASGICIYLRGEYRYLLQRLQNAIDQSKQHGFLPDNDITICEGAGAYVCGEESALMNSIQGKRGEVRFRPPYPTTAGLWAKPTIVNNVETLCSLPEIFSNGADWFASIGTEASAGTKVFSVSGDVARPGVYELEMGSTLEELVVGLAKAENVKMVQIGGASGRVLPSSMMGTRLCFEEVLGSGGVVVFDSNRDTIDMLYQMIVFLAEESCGKCAPCREGTEVLREIIGRIRAGDGFEEDLDHLKELCGVMKVSSLCGLGQGTAVPIEDSIVHFKDEFIHRIKQAEFLRAIQEAS